MDILLLEKALNTAKTLATLAFFINGLVMVAIAYRFVKRQSMRLE
jgi:cbb3-type cytochrome oxidase subunit 3